VKDDLRYELKLVCAPQQLPQARSWVRLHPAGFGVAFPPRRVNSLYLDTPHLSSLDDNLMGLAQRQKLRLRWYGHEMTLVQPVLELKQKHNLVGRKEQVPLACELDLGQPWPEILAALRSELRACGEPGAQKLALALQKTHQPTLLNHYRREYYVTPDGAVRVTLDFDQAAYDQRLSPRPNLRLRLPIAGATVIEIKTSREHASRLPQIAACFPLRRSRNSKYARAMTVALG
jgi:hypothetical protein